MNAERSLGFGVGTVLQFPIDKSKFGNDARKDLKRACLKLFSQSDGDIKPALEALGNSPPSEWPPDLLPFLKWLAPEVGRDREAGSPQAALARIFRTGKIIESPLVLTRKSLEPGDEISDNLAEHLSHAIILVEGEGDRFAVLDSVNLLFGNYLGFFSVSRDSIRLRRMSAHLQSAISRTFQQCKRASRHFGLTDPRSRLIKVKLEQLLVAPNQDMPATLAWLETLPPLDQTWLWQSLVLLHQRSQLPMRLRPKPQQLFESLHAHGLTVDPIHTTRLSFIITQVYDRIRPSRQVARGFVQTTLIELQDFLEISSDHHALVPYASRKGVERLNLGLLHLAVGGDPKELNGLGDALVEFRELYLKPLKAKPIDALMAVNPCEIIRQGLKRNQESARPDFGEPERLIQAWDALERELRQQLAESDWKVSEEMESPPIPDKEEEVDGSGYNDPTVEVNMAVAKGMPIDVFAAPPRPTAQEEDPFDDLEDDIEEDTRTVLIEPANLPSPPKSRVARARETGDTADSAPENKPQARDKPTDSGSRASAKGTRGTGKARTAGKARSSTKDSKRKAARNVGTKTESARSEATGAPSRTSDGESWPLPPPVDPQYEDDDREVRGRLGDAAEKVPAAGPFTAHSSDLADIEISDEEDSIGGGARVPPMSPSVSVPGSDASETTLWDPDLSATKNRYSAPPSKASTKGRRGSTHQTPAKKRTSHELPGLGLPEEEDSATSTPFAGLTAAQRATLDPDGDLEPIVDSVRPHSEKSETRTSAASVQSKRFTEPTPPLAPTKEEPPEDFEHDDFADDEKTEIDLDTRAILASLDQTTANDEEAAAKSAELLGRDREMARSDAASIWISADSPEAFPLPKLGANEEAAQQGAVAAIDSEADQTNGGARIALSNNGANATQDSVQVREGSPNLFPVDLDDDEISIAEGLTGSFVKPMLTAEAGEDDEEDDYLDDDEDDLDSDIEDEETAAYSSHIIHPEEGGAPEIRLTRESEATIEPKKKPAAESAENAAVKPGKIPPPAPVQSAPDDSPEDLLAAWLKGDSELLPDEMDDDSSEESLDMVTPAETELPHMPSSPKEETELRASEGDMDWETPREARWK